MSAIPSDRGFRPGSTARIKRHLITSALPYINGVKHLGNLVGSMLPADVYARYLRQRGNEVLFICATDEHGTPAELAATAAGLPVAEFCAVAHDLQARIYQGFGLSFDYFGRSSSPQNAALTQEIARQLNANGFIEERTVTQIYSPTDGRFLPDRYVEGTCPFCGFQRARGDQCENCTHVLDPTDLINPRSAISGSTDLEVRETKHLYLLQSKLQGEVEEWLDAQSADWPLLSTSIARKWLNEGLQDRAITRDLDWGVPVPSDTWPQLAAEGKVFYVWFDAPIEYIGATAEWADAVSVAPPSADAVSVAPPAADAVSLAPPSADAVSRAVEPVETPERRDWRSWWRVDEGADDVWYTQFMAKDNVPFHTVMFPATLLGTRVPWKQADYIKGFSWLTYYGGKFSTSEHRGVFTDVALDLYPADYWRYALIANAPETDDSSFTWEQFAATVNKDLADTLGNFVNRVLTFSVKKFGNEVPEGGEPGAAEAELGQQVAGLLAEYERALAELEFRKAAAAVRALWSAGNGYLVEKEPWKQIKTDPDAAALSLRTAMNLIWLYSLISEPLIPDAAAKLQAVFRVVEPVAGLVGTASGGRGPETTWPTAEQARALNVIKPGTPIAVPPVLFAKVTDEELAANEERFGK